MSTLYDVVVVGAGPAGSAAAITAARGGSKVALIERGIYPGAKSVYGGVMYLKVLDRIVPTWREEIPFERWITKRHTMVLDGSTSVTVSYHDDGWGRYPYNGVTCLRSNFDSWFASKAQLEGVDLITATTVVDVKFHSGSNPSVMGVTLSNSDQTVGCRSVVLAEGALSPLADRLGLSSPSKNHHLTLGVKEVLKLDPSTIDERFGVPHDQGVDIEILGGLSPLVGGGFLYTNRDTVSVGVIISLESLKHHQVRAEYALEQIKHHPSIEPFIKDSMQVEYLAHLIPEGGWRDRGTLMKQGVYVTGEAASSTLASGIWLEGINYAIEMGAIAGEHATRYSEGKYGDEASRQYEDDIKRSFVGKNLKKLRFAPEVVLSNPIQRTLPILLNKTASSIFTVTDPLPKSGLIKTLYRAIKEANVAVVPTIKALLKTFWSFK